MNLAWWPHTTKRSVASFRLRCWQIVGALRRRDVDAGLFDPADAPAVLVLAKRYDPRSLETAVAVRARHGTRLVLDLCDNHFDAASDDAQWQFRRQQLLAAVRQVDRVVVSTNALADVVRAHAGQAVDIRVVGDAAEPPWTPGPWSRWNHPLAELSLARLSAALGRADIPLGRRLVWFGNHGSGYADGGMGDLAHLRNALEAAQAQSPMSLTVISNHRQKFERLTHRWSLPTRYLKWHPNTVSRALQMHGVAVIPIGRNPFTLCKTNNRVATAFRHGLAVAADSIPSYQAFHDCAVLDDWQQGFQRLLRDDAYRLATVQRGQQRVLSDWTLEAIAGQWLRALTDMPSASADHVGTNATAPSTTSP